MTFNDKHYFCKICHKPVYTEVREENKIRIMQGGHQVVTVGDKSKLHLKLKCPDGHEMEIGMKQSPEQAKAEMDATFEKMRTDMETRKAEMEAHFAKMKADMEARKADMDKLVKGGPS